MKKIIIYILSLLLVIGLAGCSSGEIIDEKPYLVIGETRYRVASEVISEGAVTENLPEGYTLAGKIEKQMTGEKSLVGLNYYMDSSYYDVYVKGSDSTYYRWIPESDPNMTQTAVDLGINAENYPKIDGSTSTLVIRQAIYDAMVKQGTDYYTANYPAKASKTVPSYHLLIDGDVDMIIVPYASEDVLKAAKEKNVELEFHRIAAEALIFITPNENPTENITEEQVRSIYRDYAIKNWKELGGPDKELVPVCRNADSGSQSQLDNLILKGDEMHPDIKENYIEMTMEGMLEQTAYFHNGNETVPARDCYALGYTLFTYLQKMKPLSQAANDLKILNYEGVTPSVESIADGTYPLSDGYYVVVRKGTPEYSPVYRIIDWLCGEEGQKAIQDLDLIPCGK